MTRRRACAAVIRDGAILMVHCDHGTHAHWTLPGGGIEPGETPEAAALRELAEEASVRGTNPIFLYERPWGREGTGSETCFLIEVSPDQEPALGDDPEIEGEGQELTAVAWRSLDNLGDDVQVSSVLAALRRERPIYRARTFIPPLVRQAMALAEGAGFEISCDVETGRLLHVLAGQVGDGIVGEIGTGCAVGAAWMVTALPPAATFITVERDEQRAEAARTLLAPYPHVQVLPGDWHELLRHGPFDLLFCDTAAKREEPEEVLAALAPGGMIVLDDLTPEEHWPVEWRGQPDAVREFWLNDSRLAATEVTVSPTMQIVLATRLF